MNLSQIDVTIIGQNGIDRGYVPIAFRAWTGYDYVAIPAPAETFAVDSPDYRGPRMMRYSLLSDAFHRALLTADLLEVEFEHEGETLLLRIDKDDARADALVDAAVAHAVEWYAQRDPGEPISDAVPSFLLFPRWCPVTSCALVPTE